MDVRKSSRTLLLWYVLFLCLVAGLNDVFAVGKKDIPAALGSKKHIEYKPRMDGLYTALELSYLALNTIDLVTTFYSLDNGAKELNPIAKSFIHNKPLAVAVKGGLTLGVLWGLRQVKKQDKTAAYITLSLLNGLYGFVATNNIRVSLQL